MSRRGTHTRNATKVCIFGLCPSICGEAASPSENHSLDSLFFGLCPIAVRSGSPDRLAYPAFLEVACRRQDRSLCRVLRTLRDDLGDRTQGCGRGGLTLGYILASPTGTKPVGRNRHECTNKPWNPTLDLGPWTYGRTDGIGVKQCDKSRTINLLGSARSAKRRTMGRCGMSIVRRARKSPRVPKKGTERLARLNV